MRSTQPPGLDVQRARRLLSKAKAHRSVADRVDVLSGLLLGAPYEAHGLVGSADAPEIFTASLEGFDCVTYVETVLALARTRRVEGFAGELRRIRYDGGRVEWARRNHYMTDWVRRNARTGVVRAVSGGALASRKERLLDAVPGLPPSRVRFACVPKSRIRRLEPRLATGDLILFASTRPCLDVFHCGLLVREGDRWKVRHASRSRGGVVEEGLSGFLKSNRMSGVIVVRPLGTLSEEVTGGRPLPPAGRRGCAEEGRR